jgi:hypothetical protein
MESFLFFHSGDVFEQGHHCHVFLNVGSYLRKDYTGITAVDLFRRLFFVFSSKSKGV